MGARCSIGLRSLKSFKAGEVITQLKGLLKSPKAYTSVQYGPGSDDHIELNSDLVFGETPQISLTSLSVTESIVASEPFLRTERSL